MSVSLCSVKHAGCTENFGKYSAARGGSLHGCCARTAVCSPLVALGRFITAVCSTPLNVDCIVTMSSYLRPTSLHQALAVLAGGGYTLLAGGTDFYPGVQMPHCAPMWR